VETQLQAQADNPFDEKSELRHLSRGDRQQLEKLRPEWLRMDVAVRLFGLSRSKFYELIADRRIKSFCLRERNKRKGIRLLSYDSISQFLENESREQQEGSE
jgi:hypothetical protein